MCCTHMFDHLDKAESAESGVVAGVDHHDGAGHEAGHALVLGAGRHL